MLEFKDLDYSNCPVAMGSKEEYYGNISEFEIGRRTTINCNIERSIPDPLIPSLRSKKGRKDIA